MRTLSIMAMMVLAVLAFLSPVATAEENSVDTILLCPQLSDIQLNHASDCPCCMSLDVTHQESGSIANHPTVMIAVVPGVFGAPTRATALTIHMLNTSLYSESRVWHPNVGLNASVRSNESEFTATPNTGRHCGDASQNRLLLTL